MPASPAFLNPNATALVTGASSGIGRAVAAALRQAGLTVYGTSRQPERVQNPVPGLHWLRFKGDTADGIQDLIKAQRELLSNVDLLVNNAGGSWFGELTELPEGGLKRQHRLLLDGPVELTRAVLPGMRERGLGAVVNVSSLAAEFPLPYMVPYSACKAGLSGFTRSLMVTERGTGVVLIDFQPGDIRTAFNANMVRQSSLNPAEERAWRRMEANIARAPGPEMAARDLMRALRRGRCSIARSGGFFQARLAPLGLRLLPHSVVRWAIRHYYRIGRG
jgi:NAD(P)-dependent dehydrogenase (short-subunit alcohol dehydrogenase family)